MKDGWFRFYGDFRHDTKIRRMPIHHRYAFIVLLCLASDGKSRGLITGLDDEDIAFELEMAVEEWRILKAKFVSHGAITVYPNGDILISDWEYNQKYRDRPPAHVWRELREAIFSRDGYTCQYCGAYAVNLQCDHVIPISRGGSNDPENLVTACQRCNQSKHNKTPDEWRGGLS